MWVLLSGAARTSAEAIVACSATRIAAGSCAASMGCMPGTSQHQHAAAHPELPSRQRSVGGGWGCDARCLRQPHSSHTSLHAAASGSPARCMSTGSTPPTSADASVAVLGGGGDAASSSGSPQHAQTPPLAPHQPSAQSARAGYIPWVFSRHLTPTRHVANRMGFLMQALEQEQVQRSLSAKHIEPFRAGHVLEVVMRVPEAGAAQYQFKGLCIARYNKGVRTAFKLYNVYPESGGVVQHIPLHMPDLLSVRVVGEVPVKRSKLYYLLRGDLGSSYQAAPALVATASGEAPVSAAGQRGGGGGGGKKGKKGKKG